MPRQSKMEKYFGKKWTYFGWLNGGYLVWGGLRSKTNSDIFKIIPDLKRGNLIPRRTQDNLKTTSRVPRHNLDNT